MENPSSQNMHAISTRAITSHIGDMTSARVMDVGIGDGSQMLQVIQELAEGGSRLQELEVLGLDPNASMLELATEALTGQSTQSTGIDVSFTPLNHTLMKLRLGRLGHVDVVTSTIAFHHMPRDQKAKQLEKIRDLTPGLLVISDADTHHDIDLLKGDPRLVYNARTFYGTLFDMLKTKLPPDRAAELFDRFLTDGDIKNILTLPTRKRMEYHMSAIRWLNMLEGTGYEIIPPQPEHISGLEGASIVESDGRGYANAWRQNGKNMQFVIQAKPQR
jgi:hypothetical protein